MKLTESFLCVVLTGHGDVEAYGNRSGISDVASCLCDESFPEYSWHTFSHRLLFAGQQLQLSEALYNVRVSGPWSVADLVTSLRSLAALSRVVHKGYT